MSILTALKLTKESIAKLLGLNHTIDQSKQKLQVTKKRGRGRPVDRFIPESVVESIRRADKTFTIRELAKKHKVSYGYVWKVRNNKVRVK